MRKLNTLGMNIFAFLAISFLFLGSTDLFAQPEVKDIQRYKPAEQETSASDIYWKVYFTEPINEKSIETDDFKLSIVSGKFGGSEVLTELWQEDKDGYEWIVGAGKVESESGTIRLDFTGYVENTKGIGTSKGYKFEKGETYIYGDGGSSKGSEVVTINRFSPTQQNIKAQNVSWYVYFSSGIDGKTLTTSDFKLYSTNTANGTISKITSVSSSVYKVDLIDVSGIGNLRLDFTGTVTALDGENSKNTYTSGAQYSILTPIAVTSITRYNPAAQQFRGNSVTYRVIFNRSLNPSSVSAADFKLVALTGQLTGSITSVTGSSNVYYVTVEDITTDVTLRLDADGTFTDYNPITNSATFSTGDTYIIDFTAPVVDMATIFSNNKYTNKANPENRVTVNFRTNEIINIISATINGKTVPHNGSGSFVGSAEYTYLLTDPEGPATFEFTIVDLAGNKTTFSKTTDGSYVNFEIPTPDVVVIEQPHNVVACEGSIDKFLFVVAAPDMKGFNIVYRWWKDGRPISNWTPDFGQISFDTLRYNMSGTYKAEMFVFDSKWKSEYGNPFSFDSARVSPIIFSKDVSLYVLQRPSFLKDINPVTAGIGTNLSLTFDAQIYGEHNMNNPTYWTQIQWFRGDTPLVDDERYEGTQSSILTINDVQASDYAADYKVRLIGECETTWSNEFAISAEPFASITVQPSSVDGCVDDEVQISVEAESTLQGMPLTYQWMVDGVAIMDEAGKFNGANSPELNVTLTTDLDYDGTEEFTCQVWPVGFPSNGATSDAAMITWKTAPVITVNPFATYTAKEGEDITIFITAQGSNLSYSWTKDGDDLGIDNDTLVISSVEMDDAGAYGVKVSNECGETSRLVAVVITPGPVVTSVNANVGLGLSQNYPNPFSNNSTMTFNSERGGNATVVMTDMLGNVVANLFNGTVNAGVDTRIDINANSMNLNSGTYFITLRMGDKVETRQVSVVR